MRQATKLMVGLRELIPESIDIQIVILGVQQEKCIPHKILERFIYTRIEPVIDPLLPREQAGFRRGRSTVDQVAL